MKSPTKKTAVSNRRSLKLNEQSGRTQLDVAFPAGGPSLVALGRGHLRQHRVPFAVEPFVAPPGCSAAIIMDPDGNKLGIHKRKA